MKRKLVKRKFKKKKKGFTLIELLAVILILGIIALIAIPTINDIIKTAKKKSFQSTSYSLIEAARDQFFQDQIKGIPAAKTYTFPNSGLSVKGKQPTGGTLIINNEGNTLLQVDDGEWCAVKDYSEEKVRVYDVGDTHCGDATILDPNYGKDDGTSSFVSKWKYEDSNNDKSISIGDKITIGSEEFYIISKDSDRVRALARYSLYVGGDADGSSSTGYVKYGDKATWRQDETMKGYVSGATMRHGVAIEPMAELYAQEYKNELKKLGASNSIETSLITKQDLINLGCIESSNDCSSVREFVRGNTFWTSTKDPKYSYNVTYFFGYDKDHVNSLSQTVNYTYYMATVRPVVSILLSELNNTYPGDPTPVSSKWLYEDTDKDGTKNVGDVITFGNENFYIIANDGTNIKALTKYNLFVNGIVQNNLDVYPFERIATNMQDSRMIGYCYGCPDGAGDSLRYGATAFSNTSEDYSGSLVEGYVNTYKTKLNSLGAKVIDAEEITTDDLIALGAGLGSLNDPSKSPDFLKGLSYWCKSNYITDDGNNYHQIWTVDYNKGIYVRGYSEYWVFGVRPVIKIALSELNK